MIRLLVCAKMNRRGWVASPARQRNKKHDRFAAAYLRECPVRALCEPLVGVRGER